MKILLLSTILSASALAFTVLQPSTQPNDICTSVFCAGQTSVCAMNPPCLEVEGNCVNSCHKEKKCITNCVQSSGNGQAIELVKCIVTHGCQF